MGHGSPPKPAGFRTLVSIEDILPLPLGEMSGRCRQGRSGGGGAPDPLAEGPRKGTVVVAKFDFQRTGKSNQHQLSLHFSELVAITSDEDRGGCWQGHDRKGNTGWFPATYVEFYGYMSHYFICAQPFSPQKGGEGQQPGRQLSVEKGDIVQTTTPSGEPVGRPPEGGEWLYVKDSGGRSGSLPRSCLEPASLANIEELRQRSQKHGSGDVLGGGQAAVRMQKTSSKYDFVKVQVRLGEHSYIFSRFILSRILTVIQVKSVDAVKVSLDLKKRLVDDHKVDIPQTELQERLFAVMKEYGYTDTHIERFQMMSRFHNERVPLLIIISGATATGKSTLATRLAEVLNLPNIVSTDMMLELMAAMGTFPTSPCWQRSYSDLGEFTRTYQQECATVRAGLEGDLDKCFGEGKALIVEGSHLMPSMFFDLKHHCLVQPPVVTPRGRESLPAPDEPQEVRELCPTKKGRKKGIIVPVLLYLDESERPQFLRHWHSDKPRGGAVDLNEIEPKIGCMDGYLMEEAKESEKSLPFLRVKLNLTDINATVAHIQEQVLHCIELAYKAKTF